LTHAIHRGP